MQHFESEHFPKPEIQQLHDKVSSLQSSLDKIFPVIKRNHRSSGKDLEVKIRDAVYKAQDAIESFVYRENLRRSESDEVPGEEQSSISVLLPEIIANIDPIRDKAEKLAVEIGHGKNEPLVGDLSEPSISIRESTRIVGQNEDKKLVKAAILNEDDQLTVIPITGLPGIGKTTLARSIYDDTNIESHFNVRAWVTVSQDYNVGDILTRLINTMESKGRNPGDKPVSQGKSEGELRVHLHQSLFNTRYLIVIDDMWDIGVWDEVRNALPDTKIGSRVLLTTRISKLADSIKTSSFNHVMKPLGEEDSWELLCVKAFRGMDLSPPHLEIIGRKIATNCRGLPLSITVIGGLLSKERPSMEDWQRIEEDTHAAAAKGEDDSYLEILFLSYAHLPGYLKGCFLYMGAFPEDSDILVSKLVKLWVSEGFLKPSQSVETVAEKSLEELIDRNLLRISRNHSDGRIKTCAMHDSLRDLAVQESVKEKFFHSVRTINVRSPEQETDRSQRRVSVHTNIVIMYSPHLYNSTKSITAARTLLYVGHHYHHPMPSFLCFDLLRVLDACAVYFIHFPYEVIKLVHLRYLSLTYNGELPSSVSRLRNLQVLVLLREPKIVHVGITYLPDEIWNMPELRHLLSAETDFPRFPVHKHNDGLLFANLQSLSDVHAASCTREVLKNMPGLKKLSMWIDSPGAVGLYLDELEELRAFKFSVLNPIPDEKVEFQPEIFFPETLRRLTLRGCGLPWEDMEIIAKLPNLQVLKLREIAFQGERWCPTTPFEKLKYLLLEYVQLKIWKATSSDFPILESLILRHCYELEEISTDIGYIGDLKLIELVDCSPAAVECAEEISEEQKSFDNSRLHVRIFCSWK
ncbi:hypothetical protein C2S52_010105 [Perilla frutescens var. hirtella]|nr:hypothetical protein C2S52_010105 [Perilla frutescens var. hirtella]